MRTVNTDVLVVGAGPAGLTAAALLAAYGVDAVTITKYPGTAHTPRAHITNQRTMEIFRELGIEDRVKATAMSAAEMALTVWATSFAGTELARMYSWGQGPDRRGEYEMSSPCQMCNAPQNVVEPLIAAAAQERGANVRFSHELITVDQDDTQVCSMIRVRDRDSDSDSDSDDMYAVHSMYLIAADGANSTVAAQLGIPMNGRADIASAMTVWLEADLTRYVAHRSGALFCVCPPGRGIWATPWVQLTPHHEWSALFLHRDMIQMDTSDAAVSSLIAACIGDPAVEFRIKHVSQWQINELVADYYRSGRIFLAGDAAHRHSPANGLGSNTSIQDAYNLAWKLAAVLAGRAGSALLDTYDAERRPVGCQVVDRSSRSLQEVMTLTDPIGLAPGQTAKEGWEQVHSLFAATSEDATRRQQVLDALELINSQLNCHGVELGQQYRSTAVIDDGTPESPPTVDSELYYRPSTTPGHYLPHVWLQRGTDYVSTLDITGHGRFTVITGVSGQAWIDAARKIAADLGIDIAAHAIGMRTEFDDVWGTWTRVRGIDDSGCLLVRPDRHIAWRSRAAQPDPQSALSTALRSILALPETGVRAIAR
jgi:2,4-dichlorophenol 6-monooxygenase